MADRSSKRARHSDAPIPMSEVISEEDILALVSQREQARQNKNYAQSDELRETLRQMGIEVFDKEKTWKAKDGRRGVLFTAGPHECVLGTSDIQERINDREKARSSKDWAEADQLRDNLRELGVELDDKNSRWKTSSGRAGTYAGHVIDASAPTSRGAGNSEVERLIAERERLRAARDFDGADELRKQLSQQGVEVYDQERTWRSADGRSGVIITGGHQGKCSLRDNEIMRRISQREDARSAKDWGKADTIRDELRQKGVELLDKEKSWQTTDGRQGSYAGGSSWQEGWQGPSYEDLGMFPVGDPRYGTSLPWSGGAAGAMLQAAAPAGGLSLSSASITALIHGRERARENRDWQGADAIREDLRNCGIEVWDKDKCWRASDGRSGAITKPN